MARDTTTQKNKNRRMRQDALREQLSKQKHVEHVIEIVNELNDVKQELDQLMVQRKSVEVVDEEGNDALPKSITINVVSPDTNS